MNTKWVRGSSTWVAPQPEFVSDLRVALIARLSKIVTSLGDGRHVVAIDGRTAAGKTTLADQLAQTLSATRKGVFRASLDDFKRPWRDRHLYDRESGDGYYRNAFDNERIQSDLVEGFRTGLTMLCSIDPITQVDHSAELVPVPDQALLIVDGVFAFRSELNELWDLRVWVDVDAATSARRAQLRDGRMLDRYRVSEEIYLSEVRPREAADIVIGNQDVSAPVLSVSRPR